jgi:hypothetical protein
VLADSIVDKLKNFEYEVESLKHAEEESIKHNTFTRTQNLLLDSVKIMVPEHLESDTQSSILMEIKNTSPEPILNFIITFPDSEEFFTISGELKLSKILPGIEIEHMLTIRPKFHKGTFPLNVKIMGNDISVTITYSIKVGGTEIY